MENVQIMRIPVEIDLVEYRYQRWVIIFEQFSHLIRKDIIALEGGEA